MLIQQKWTRCLFTLVGLLAVAITHAAATPASAGAPKHVLVFQSLGPGNPQAEQFYAGLREAMPPLGNVEWRFEYIAQANPQVLATQYQDWKPDVLISCGPPATDSALYNQSQLFHGVPLVFGNIFALDAKLSAGHPVTGQFSVLDHEDNVKLALRLFPKTKRVYVFTDPMFGGAAKEQARHFMAMKSIRGVPLEFRESPTLLSMLDESHNIAPNSLIYFLSLAHINAATFSAPEKLRIENSPCPIFISSDFFLGAGPIGGKVPAMELAGKSAGELARQILQGTPVQQLPPRTSSISNYEFDARQLDRWGISSSQLPPGSRVLFREPPFYQTHPKVLIGGAVLGLLFLGLVARLLLGVWRMRKLDRMLRMKDERFQRLVDCLNEGVAVLGPDGAVLHCNEQLRQMLNVERDQLVGQRLIEFAGEEARPVLQKLIQRPGKARQSSAEVEWIAGAERRVPALVTAGRLSGEDGSETTLMIVMDLSDRKALQERVARAEKMELLGQLAGGVAHDLNNVLSGVVSHPDLLLLDLPVDSSLREPLMVIKKSGERAAAIVEDLLTLTRRGVAARELVNLNAIIENYLSSPECAALKAQHPKVDFETVISPPLLKTNGSPFQLGKVLMNLVSNACEAMPTGGVISIRCENCYLDRPLQGYELIPEGEYALIQVRDTGMGISAADHNRLFEPFYTKKSMGRSGTGLGLTVVWGTIKDHNGYINVESAPGRGTTFSLYLPLTRASLGVRPHEQNLDHLNGHGERVLIIDDVPAQREIATHMLRALKYEPEAVANGHEAVARLRQGPPVDVLLLDMIMEDDMDGLDTYREILTFAPGQKAVITSGFAQTERVHEAQRLGARCYLKKPYVLRQLAQVLQDALGESPAAQEREVEAQQVK